MILIEKQESLMKLLNLSQYGTYLEGGQFPEMRF